MSAPFASAAFDVALHEFIVHGNCRAHATGGRNYDLVNLGNTVPGRETSRHARQIAIVGLNPSILSHITTKPFWYIGALFQWNAQKQSVASNTLATLQFNGQYAPVFIDDLVDCPAFHANILSGYPFRLIFGNLVSMTAHDNIMGPSVQFLSQFDS
ncbi:MAG: hypothetical protein NVS9B12_14200 [Vulcanimicrobiaceae bacterium]